MSPDDLRFLEDLQLGAVIDVRDTVEDRSTVLQWAASARVPYHHVPITIASAAHLANLLQEARTSSADSASLLGSVYRSILNENGDAIARVAGIVATASPAAFGCAAGKDRTGVIAAIFEDLIGMAPNDIVSRYTASAPNVESVAPLLKGYEGYEALDVGSAGVRTFLGAPEIAMWAMLEHLRSNWGTAENYLVQHGVVGETVRRLKDTLLEHHE